MTPDPVDLPVVVVLTDGSWDSRRAVGAAALEARAMGLELTVLVLTSALSPVGHPDPAPPSVAMSRAVLESSRLAPDLVVNTVAAQHDSREVARLATHARLLVVGCYDRGGRPALAPGSVTADLAARFPAPVLVVGHDPAARPGAHPHPHVVVGLSGAPDDAVVAGYALEEARRRAWPVVAVCAVSGPVGLPRRAEQLTLARQAAQEACSGDGGTTLIDVRVEAVGHDPLGALRWHCGPRDLAVVGHHSSVHPSFLTTSGGAARHPGSVGALEPASLAARLLHTGLSDMLVVPLDPR